MSRFTSMQSCCLERNDAFKQGQDGIWVMKYGLMVSAEGSLQHAQASRKPLVSSLLEASQYIGAVLSRHKFSDETPFLLELWQGKV